MTNFNLSSFEAILHEAIDVLSVLVEESPPHHRTLVNPAIDALDGIVNTACKEDGWYTDLRLVTRRIETLAEFFTAVGSDDQRAEFYVRHLRKVAARCGLQVRCRKLGEALSAEVDTGALAVYRHLERKSALRQKRSP